MSLQCEYCGSAIHLTDKTCPKCGANTFQAIEAEKQRLGVESEKQKYKTVIDAQRKKAIIFAAVVIFFGVQLLCGSALSVMSLIQDDSGTSKTTVQTTQETTARPAAQEQNVTAGYQESAQLSDRTVLLDNYTCFNYVYDQLGVGVKDKEKRMAFHFRIDNTSSSNISFQDEILCLADGVVVEDCYITNAVDSSMDIEDETIRAIDELAEGSIYTNAAREGWRAFIIPKDKKKLAFRIGDYIVIQMDNPIYGEY